MQQDMQAVARECTEASDEGRLKFPQIVGRLIDAGVERYHADLTRWEKTYYAEDGSSCVVKCAPVEAASARAFSADGVEAAIRASQAGAITYKKFCERIIAAGCVGYIVSLAGRRAVYFGRTGASHVEPFPQAS